MSKIMKIWVIVLLIFSVVVGVFFGYLFRDSKLKKEKQAVRECLEEKAAYQAGYDTATKQFIDAKIYDPASNKLGPKKLRGPIREVDGNLLKVALLPLGPVEMSAVMSRTVKIGDNTKIYFQMNKDRLEYQKELAEYHAEKLKILEENPLSTTTLPMPGIFEQKEIDKSELKSGVNITVVFENDNGGGDIDAIEIYTQDFSGLGIKNFVASSTTQQK